MSDPVAPKRRRFALPLIIAGAVASLVLALGVSPTVAAFTASIQNSTNTAGTGYLSMQEVSGANTCNSTDGGSISTNSATCATINKYGGTAAPLAPGGTQSTTVTIKNTGSITANAFTLTPSACTQSNLGSPNGTATDLCSQITLKITSGATTVYNGTLAAFSAPVNLVSVLGGTVAPGATTSFTFQVTLASTAGNTYQGLQVSQPLTWSFSS